MPCFNEAADECDEGAARPGQLRHSFGLHAIDLARFGLPAKARSGDVVGTAAYTGQQVIHGASPQRAGVEIVAKC